MARERTTHRTLLDKPVTRRGLVVAGGAALACAPAAAHAAGIEAIIKRLSASPDAADAPSADGDAQVAQPAASGGGARPTLLQNLQAVDPAGTPAVPAYEVASDFSNVINIADAYLADVELEMLRANGFFMLASSYGGEFFEVYEMNRYNLFPNLVTVDSLAHTYHLYFLHLQRGIERSGLAPALTSLSAAMLSAAGSQLEALRGTEWEAAARRCVAFFAVGASLLDAATQVPAEVADTVSAELSLIGAAGGISPSPLTGTDADYSQYIVRGYYAGDAALEPYFRAMMWYGGVNFPANVEDMVRSALLVTLALGGDPLASWSSIYTVTSFFAGASDDCGYYEYRPLFDQAYGAQAGVADLPGNDACWQAFLELVAQTPAPAINSIPLMDVGTDVDHLEENKGFRFMGQRFSIDAAIMQELVYNRVSENAAGEQRLLPDALDVPAAFGSDVALAILDEQGATGFAGYTEKMESLRAGIDQATDDLWTASLAAQWLAMLRPLLTVKGEGYPLFAQGEAWARRNLVAFAGSYAELKHDTVLYAKQVMAEAGGGPLEERDDRGYVEPEPEFFGRLAALVDATSKGLSSLGLLGEADASNLTILQQLSTQLETIARKELRNEVPTAEEFDLIRAYGAQLEHFWQEVCKDDAEDDMFTTRDFPSAIVTDIATDPNGLVLQIGTNLSTVYAIVPVEGVLRVASGAAFSFYQFEQPIDQRLTDHTWRQMLGIAALEDGTYIYDPAQQPTPVAWSSPVMLTSQQVWG